MGAKPATQEQTRHVDVVVVGGGMVGASFALALAGSGLEVLVVESIVPGAGSQPSFDDRTTALGNASRRIFRSTSGVIRRKKL